MKREDDFLVRREHLAGLTDVQLEARFWELANKLVEYRIRFPAALRRLRCGERLSSLVPATKYSYSCNLMVLLCN